jgi:hypothetical protein
MDPFNLCNSGLSVFGVKRALGPIRSVVEAEFVLHFSISPGYAEIYPNLPDAHCRAVEEYWSPFASLLTSCVFARRKGTLSPEMP